MSRPDSTVLATGLVAGVAVLLIFISLAHSYLVHSVPLKLATSTQLLLVEIPELAFRSFRVQFLVSLLIFAVLTIALARLFPNPIRNRFVGFCTLVTFVVSLVWVAPLVDMSSMLSLQFSAGQSALPASLAHTFAVLTHPWIAWTLIPVLFALYGMFVGIILQRFSRTERN